MNEVALFRNYFFPIRVESFSGGICGAVVKHRTRDREVPGSIPTKSKCCFLEQETLSTLLSTGFYPGKNRTTWKISTKCVTFYK